MRKGLEEQLDELRAQLRESDGYRIVNPWNGMSRMRHGMVAAIVASDGCAVYDEARNVAYKGPETRVMGRHCADRALERMGLTLLGGVHPAPVIESRWHTSTVPPGGPPLGTGIPNGWERTTDWEVVTAVSSAAAGITVVWKVRIQRREEIGHA